MALNYSEKTTAVDNPNTNLNNNNHDLFGKDAEKQSLDNGRRGSNMDSSDEASVSVGKQIQLEAGNAIQYRTCSWQKVCYYSAPARANPKTNTYLCFLC